MFLSVDIQYIDIRHLQAVGRHIMLISPPLLSMRKVSNFKMSKHFLCRIYYIFTILLPYTKYDIGIKDHCMSKKN